MKFIKRNEIKLNKKTIDEMCDSFGISSEVVSLLFARGFDNKEKINKFLHPSVSDFHNPFLFPDMQKVVDKINNHIMKNSKFLIVGDYDADGVCASAILYRHFKSLGIDIECFLPNRFDDGYGLTMESADKIVTLYHPDIIITVDCGISCYKEVDYLKSLGIDIIVTDHHEVPLNIPDCLIIDPKLGNDYPFSGLCGAGVALKVVQALSGMSNAYNYIAIASIATVADIVPLIDENRAIVYYGLKVFDEQVPYGVKLLIKELKLPNITSYDIAFKIAPKINTAGRMADAKIAFNLFVSDDERQIKENLALLTNLNDERIAGVNDILQDIDKEIETTNIGDKHIMIFASDKWKAGVLGIACARLVDRFHRPVICLSKVGDEYKGSARSIPSIDIFKAMSMVQDNCLRFGGHSQAGGLTILADKFDEFCKKIEDYIASEYEASDFYPIKQYDIDITKANIDEDYLKQFDVLEPTGYANEKPVFMYDISLLRFSKMKNHNEHIKTCGGNLEIVGFGYGHLMPLLMSNCKKSAIMELNLSEFRGERKVKGNIRYLSNSGILSPITKEIEQGNIVSNMSPYAHRTLNLVIESEVYDELCLDLKNSAFGTIIVAETFSEMKKFLDKYTLNDIDYSLYSPSEDSGINTLLLSPRDKSVYKDYQNIYFVGSSMVELDDGKKVKYFDMANNSSIFDELVTDRIILGVYHNCIKKTIEKGIKAESKYDFFCNMKKLNPEYNIVRYPEFCFALRVFEELKFFKVDYDDFMVSNDTGKQPLTNSVLYNFVKTNKGE